jgi:hypothetical protein
MAQATCSYPPLDESLTAGRIRSSGVVALSEALTTMGGAADALVASVENTESTDGRDGEAERRRRLERLAPGAPGASTVVRMAVYLLTASVLVLPTVVVVVPWLDRALMNWPL